MVEIKKQSPAIKIVKKDENVSVILKKTTVKINTPALQGIGGASAYQIWIEEGNTGTEQDFLDSLQGASGVHDFILLRDTPSSYSGQAGNVVKVKSDESGLEFGTISLSGYLQNNVGIAGGTTLIGGTSTTDDLILQTTSGVGATGADMIFRGGNNGATEFMRILNNGNIGIGTTAPTTRLNVIGDGSATDSGMIRSSHSLTNNANKYGGFIVPHYNNSVSVDITGFWVSAQSSATELLVGGGLGGKLSPTSISFYTGTNNITAGIERLKINSSGNIGIGTASPSSVASKFIHIYDAGSAGYSFQNSVRQWSFFVQGGSGNYGLYNHSTASYAFMFDGSNRITTQLSVMRTTEQIRSGYDASNYWNATTDATGLTTFVATGTGPYFRFNNNIGIKTAPVSGTAFAITGVNDGVSGTKTLTSVLATTMTGYALAQNNQQIYTAWTPSANTDQNIVRGTTNQLIKAGSYNATSGSTVVLYGNYATVQAQGSGNLKGMAGFGSIVGADYGFTGTLTNAIHFLALSPLSAGGTITNCYGLYIEEQKKSVVTNSYGVYQISALDINYFNGKTGFGTPTPTGLLDVNADLIRIRTSKTPASASDAGNQGEIAWDSSFIYVCTATNTWERAAIATW